MPIISLPDGSQREFSNPTSIYDLAADIGPGLAKAALAGKVDGKEVDLGYVIDQDAEVSIITEKSPEGLEIIRHSTAHLLAQAVKELFPEAQVTIGPVIEDGFYYDFAYHRAFTPEDLERIEQRMTRDTGEDRIRQRTCDDLAVLRHDPRVGRGAFGDKSVRCDQPGIVRAPRFGFSLGQRLRQQAD